MNGGRKVDGTRLIAGVVVGSVVLATGGAQAEDAALEEMVVTATRTERPLFETPIAASVLDREAVIGFQPLGFADVFEGVPGVAIQGGARRIAEEPNIRGFLDTQVVIRHDGARQNFDLAHRGRFFVDPDLIQRVEVVRGSASALYGSGALGGVISVETRGADDLLRPGETLGGRVRLGYQTNGDEPFVSAGVFGRAGPVDAFANFVYREVTEDLEDGSGQPILDSQDRLLNGLINIGFQPAEHHRIELIGDLFDNQGENPTNANDTSSPTTVVDRDTQQTNLRLNYRYNDPNNPWVDFTAVAYYSDIDVTEDRFFDDRLDASDFQSFGVDLFNTTRLLETDTVDLRVTYGFEYFEDEQSGTRDGDDRIQFPDAELSFVAGYAQAEITLWDIVSIIPGLRYDSFELEAEGDLPSRDEDEVTPRVAVGIKPHPSVYLWGSYAEAFRAPSLTELYVDGVHFAVPFGQDPVTGVDRIVVNEFVPSPDLEPERAQTFEVGVRFRHEGLLFDDDTIELSGNYFTSDVDDFVEQIVVFISGAPSFTPPFGPLVFPGVTLNRNVDARIQGFEAEIRYDSTYLFAALTGFTLDGDNRDTDEGLGSIPQDSFTLRLEGKLPDRWLRFGGRLTVADAQTDVPTDSIATPAYETLDLFVSWAPQAGRLDGVRFTLGVDNVWDEDFTVHPNAIAQPGRSVRLTAAYRFGL